MQLCFYRETGMLAAFIRWWTGSPWAHVEFEFTGGRHWGALMGGESDYQPFRPPDMIMPVPCEVWQENLLINWCTHERGCPYDWYGVFAAQFLNRARSTTDAWFCSEVCVAGLQYIDMLPGWLPACSVSPGRLEQIWRYIRSEIAKNQP